jgi:hypothetical protein
MTTGTLLTVNIGGVLCEHARQSLVAAAERWGAAYVEVTEATRRHPVRQPATLKLAAFAYTTSEAVFIVDADAVISARCPNPFQTLPADLLSVVDLTPRVDPVGAILRHAEGEWKKVSAQPLGGWPYFNSGVMLAWREAHEAVFRQAYDLAQRQHPPLVWAEQTPLNYACQNSKVTLCLIDERWNYMRPQTLGPSWKDLAQHGIWIMHLAGDGQKYQLIPTLDWQGASS